MVDAGFLREKLADRIRRNVSMLPELTGDGFRRVSFVLIFFDRCWSPWRFGIRSESSSEDGLVILISYSSSNVIEHLPERRGCKTFDASACWSTDLSASAIVISPPPVSGRLLSV